MKRLLLPSIVAFSLAGCAGMPETSSSSAPASYGAGTPAAQTAAIVGGNEMRMAFDVGDANPDALMLKLTVIDMTRKQLIDAGVTPRIVVAFRGDASYYTQTDLSKVKEADRAGALKIRAKLKELRTAKGVESMEQCNIPLKARKLEPKDIMQEVKLVPNGWISLVAYQKQGYGYIIP